MEVGAIVLVHWQIRPECEAEFLSYWRTSAVVRDRVGLIGEFLNKVERNTADAPWITWALMIEVDKTVQHYVNVGMWTSEPAFLQQISGDFGDAMPLRPFEQRRRRRLLLRPQAWRIGAAAVPGDDSAGVL